jgi:hypothetical protein
MSFWSWWSQKPVAATPNPILSERRPTFTETDRDFVRVALDRFEAIGLRIWPILDRDLIVARALIDANLWMREDGGRPKNELQPLFLTLAFETDSLTYYVDEVGQLFAPLARMDANAAEEILQEHSYSIFENANTICTVNEDNSLENMVHDIAALTRGALEVSHISRQVMKNGLTKVSFQVEGLGECHFEIENLKRPDVTPTLIEMNRIAKSKGIGQYIMFSDGNSESMIFIFAAEAVLSDITGLLKIASSETARARSP